MANPLDKVLELVPVEHVEPQLPAVVNAHDDFDFARKSVRKTVDCGEKALTEILEIGQYTNQPRAYEVAGQLMRAIFEGNRELLALKKTQQDITERASRGSGPKTIHNNLVVTSSEMLDLIKKNLSAPKSPKNEAI